MSIDRFLQGLADKQTHVGIFGLGYVGIPLAQRIASSGFRVTGFDIDEERVAKLNAGQSPIKHIADASIASMLAGGFAATTEYSKSAACDALVICVPTPLNRYREPDLGFVEATMHQLEPYLRTGQLLSLESTTWPGTTEEVLKPFIDGKGLICGDNFFLIYSPEREDPGNAHFNTQTIPKVVGGHSPDCLRAGQSFYGTFIDKVVTVSSTRAAEMVKLLENIHRSVNIGLANEMKVVADRMGLDIFEIIGAAATKPFGFTPYYPGPGIGGHCIPIDPFYLTWKAREYGMHTRFIELAGEINADMPRYVVDKITGALNDKSKSLKGARVLALGIAYKRDVDDMRESPSVLVMELLRDLGAIVSYSDPNVPRFPKMREHNFDLESLPLTPETLGAQDVVVLLTDHTAFDYALIRAHAPLLVDTRGKFEFQAEGIVRA